MILHDLNGDGETDFYECFNSDHQVTEHFHEFAMGLQTDAAGQLLLRQGGPARAAGRGAASRHAAARQQRRLADGHPGHRLSRGERRLPQRRRHVLRHRSGRALEPQEPHQLGRRPGKFYGNMWGYHDVTDPSDAAMEQPLCWITNAFDRSPGELLWVPASTWGPLAGSLLNLSYGTGKMFVVPHERSAGQKQGGMCALPIAPFPTGVMRGRFHPRDGQLYCCGMFAWAGNATQPGGLYRIRYTGRPMTTPIGLAARRGRFEITFSEAIDKAVVSDTANYTVKTWSLKRTANYGSDHFNEKPLRVESAEVSSDGRTVTLHLPSLEPTWCMEIACRLQAADGTRFDRVIHNSVFKLAD